MFKKCIFILATSCMMYSCTTQTETNPFLTEFQTEHGVPPFDKIKLEHYEPAFLKGIEEQNANIDAIVNNSEAPTFENVIVALDNSSPILDRVSAIFYNMTEAETTDDLKELSIKLAPTLSEHSDNISLNQDLFKKVDAVYQQKDALGLTTEQQRLLEETYKGFVRSGANLSPEKQARLREVNKELSTLGIKFSDNVLNENNAFSNLALSISSIIAPSFMAKTPIESPSTNSILRCSSFTEVRVEDFPAWDYSSKSATIARIVKGTPSQPVYLFSIAKIQTNLEYKYAEIPGLFKQNMKGKRRKVQQIQKMFYKIRLHRTKTSHPSRPNTDVYSWQSGSYNEKWE